MTPAERAALRALAEKATPGPWKGGGGVFGPPPELRTIVETDGGFYPPGPEDEELIVAARNALPALLDYIDDLEREVARAQDQAQRWEDIANTECRAQVRIIERLAGALCRGARPHTHAYPDAGASDCPIARAVLGDDTDDAERGRK